MVAKAFPDSTDSRSFSQMCGQGIVVRSPQVALVQRRYDMKTGTWLKLGK